MAPLSEEKRLYYKNWRKKNKERLKEYNKSQYNKHKETIRNNAKKKYHSEKDNIDSKFFEQRNRLRFINKIKSLQKVSGLIIPECCICGEKDPRLLSINHINGNGQEDNKHYGNMSNAVQRGRDISDLDVRCFNCNMLYEYECKRKGPDNWKQYYDEYIKECNNNVGSNVINDIHVTLTKK